MATGTIDVVLEDVTCDAEGHHANPGYIDVYLDGVTMAATGYVKISGVIAAILSGVTCVGSGRIGQGVPNLGDVLYLSNVTPRIR